MAGEGVWTERALSTYKSIEWPRQSSNQECIALLTRHSLYAIQQYEKLSNYPSHFVDRIRWIYSQVNDEYQQNRVRKQEQDLRKGEIQISILEGKVIDREVLIEFFGAHVGIVREMLDQFEKQCAPFRKLSDSLGQHIDDLFHDFRNELSRLDIDELVKYQRRKHK